MAAHLSRRDFVRTTAAALVAGPVATASPSPSSAPPPPRRARFKKAVKLGMVQDGATLRDKLALLKDLGFAGVEPDSPNDLDRVELLAARDATGVEIIGVVDSVHWGKPFSHPDAAVRAEGVAALRTAIGDAKAYGASSVLVVPAVVNAEVGYDQAWERCTAEIRKVLPDAAAAGVQLAFENVWNNFLLSPLEFARFVDQFDSPWARVHFDIGNVVKYGWPQHWIRILGKRIAKLDVKGYSHKVQFAAEIDDCDVDWAAVRAALAEVGYQGWATAEVDGGGRQRLADIAARMDRALNA